MDQLYGLLAQLGISAAGKASADEQTAQGKDQLLNALARLNRLQTPDLPELSPDYLGQSAAGQMTADPSLKAAQMDQLAALQRIADSGGLTLEDKGALNQSLNRQTQNMNTNRQALENSMASRGTLDSGSQLAVLLAGQQQAAQNSAMNGATIAAQAQKRALDAIAHRGQLAGAMDSQDFSQRFAAAQARDAISRYNADAANKARAYNAGLPQQNFQNQITKINGQNAAGGNLAGFALGQADKTNDYYSGLGVAARNGINGAIKQGSSSSSGSNPSEWEQYPGSSPPLVSADPNQYTVDENGKIRMNGDK